MWVQQLLCELFTALELAIRRQLRMAKGCGSWIGAARREPSWDSTVTFIEIFDCHLRISMCFKTCMSFLKSLN